jgi:hypothetical protein
VDFWFNHFNVFAGKGQTRGYLTEYERDTIRPHVLGKFRDLLGATAQSPAMLFFLDNWQSTAPPDAEIVVPTANVRATRPNGPVRPIPRRPAAASGRPITPDQRRQVAQVLQNRRGRGLNENYARELMELHTLGVDGGYTQKDVQEVARALTGWTIQNPRLGGGFVFQPRWEPLGKIYYTLEALGEDRKLSPDVFKAIHGQGMNLSTDKTFFDWAASKGLDRKKVEEVYGSFAINGKMSRARQQAQQYNVQSVPTVVVDGKFVTGSERVGTHAQLPAALDELVAKARAERKGK